MLITSKDNNRIKEVRKLLNKKYSLQKGLFVIEGENLVEEAIKNDLCKTWGISPDYLNWSPLSPGATKPHFNLLIDDRGGLESSINILTGLFDKIDNK